MHTGAVPRKRRRKPRNKHPGNQSSEQLQPHPLNLKWLLAVPHPALHAILLHCTIDLPGIQGLLSLLATCRTAYDALAEPIYEAIDPGCSAAWVEVRDNYLVQLSATQALAARALPHVHWFQACKVLGERLGNCPDADTQLWEYSQGRCMVSSEEFEELHRKAATKALARGLVASVPQRVCPVRPTVRSMWQAHRPDRETGGPQLVPKAHARVFIKDEGLLSHLAVVEGADGPMLRAADFHRAEVEVDGPGSLGLCMPDIIASVGQYVAQELVPLARARRAQKLKSVLQEHGLTHQELDDALEYEKEGDTEYDDYYAPHFHDAIGDASDDEGRLNHILAGLDERCVVHDEHPLRTYLSGWGSMEDTLLPYIQRAARRKALQTALDNEGLEVCADSAGPDCKRYIATGVGDALLIAEAVRAEKEACQVDRWFKWETQYVSILARLKVRQRAQLEVGVQQELQEMARATRRKLVPSAQVKLMSKCLTQLSEGELEAVARDIALEEWLAKYESFEDALEDPHKWCMPESVERRKRADIKQREERERAQYAKVWVRFFKQAG